MITEHHVELNTQVLQQGLEIISTLDESTWQTRALGQSSAIGCHFRHCFDFYGSFLRGARDGHVDYDSRERSSDVESSPRVAQAHAQQLIEQLGQGDWPDDATIIRVCSEQTTHGSTIGRELRFLLSHTVHHYAMIALMLRSLGIETPAGFGVAPSTLRHWDGLSECAR